MIIEQDLIPKGRKNRPGKKNTMQFITLHETGNTAHGADARSHAKYLKGEGRDTSWHYTVDDTRAVRHLPDDEVGYHAGSTAGNASSIGIEVCVNADGDLKRAYENTAFLCRKLCKEHGIPHENIVFHHKWNGKDCPKNLRRGVPFSFAEFLNLVRDDAVSPWAKTEWERAKTLGITDGTRPKDTASREEVVCMILRAMKQKGE